MSDETDIYRRQGFAQSVGFGTRPALLIVDFVVGFTDPAHFGGGNIGPAIDRTVTLLAHARALGWPVAHTRVVYAEDGSDAGAFTAKVPSLLKLTEASPLSQIVARTDAGAGRTDHQEAPGIRLLRHRACRMAALSRRRHAAGRRLHDLGLHPRQRGRRRQPQFPHGGAHRLRRRPGDRPA